MGLYHIYGGVFSMFIHFTVFSVLNKGFPCSIDKFWSFLLCVSMVLVFILFLLYLIWNITDGMSRLGVWSLRAEILSLIWLFKNLAFSFDFTTSFCSKLFWNLWTASLSKQSLLGILNLRNFGIMSAFLQFSKKHILCSHFYNFNCMSFIV